MVLGEVKSVLFREVSLFQGCPYRGVQLLFTQQVRRVLLYTDMYINFGITMQIDVHAYMYIILLCIAH